MAKKLKKPQKKSKTIQKTPEVSMLEKLFKEHVIFWLVLFPPVGIYKLFKSKIVGKKTMIAIIIFLSLILTLSIYKSLNPTIVIDNHLTIAMENLEFGNVRQVDYIGAYEDYLNSEVITTQGYYTVYYRYKEDNSLEIDCVLELNSEMNENLVYNEFNPVFTNNDFPELLTKIHPAAIKFLINNSDYGIIEEIQETAIDYQVFLIDGIVYKYYYEYYETVKIQKNIDDEFVDIMNRDYVLKFREDFRDALNKNKALKQYYEVSEILTYGINEESIYYIFQNFCGNIYRISKYNDGRIVLEVADDVNQYSQEDLAILWEQYKEASSRE